MNDWLAALSRQTSAAVLVTVAMAEGSVPREPGAKMLVTADAQFDTIGGGHLELSACTFARTMLDARTPRHLERFALGPTLGQCCGGVVWLVFERIETNAQDFFNTLVQRRRQGLGSWRVIALDGDLAPALLADGAVDAADDTFRTAMQSRSTSLVRDASGQRWLLDPCLPHSAHLFLFGAGHVGAAIVRALAELPCRVTWIDAREQMFPATLPANVSVEATDTPEALIDAAPAGASFLVMTHNHALDQQLAEHILRRSDGGWFGLIGSRTKRIQFERRLRQRGIAADRLAGMVCPIGVDGIEGKAPAVIAIAVAAQLLQVWEEQARAASQPESNNPQQEHIG